MRQAHIMGHRGRAEALWLRLMVLEAHMSRYPPAARRAARIALECLLASTIARRRRAQMQQAMTACQWHTNRVRIGQCMLTSTLMRCRSPQMQQVAFQWQTIQVGRKAAGSCHMPL